MANPGLSDCKETESYFVYNDTPDTSPNARSKNVIIFGETGTGKSSVINLMAGRNIAEISSSPFQGCTQQVTEYSFTLNQVPLCVFDTVGLEKSEMDININTIEMAHELITNLNNSGRIDLLLFCIKGGRFTASTQRNYHLFSEILCNNRVPLALVITHLENEDVMEDWWERNKKTFERFGIYAIAHACITTLQDPTHMTLHLEKQIQSQRALQKLFHDALINSPNPSCMQDLRNWFVAFIEKALSPLTRKRRRNIVMKKLETYCALPRDEVQRLVESIVKR